MLHGYLSFSFRERNPCIVGGIRTWCSVDTQGARWLLEGMRFGPP